MTSRAERAERARGTRCCDGEARPMVSADEGRVCVCDLEAAMTVKQPTVSHHLKLLREAGIVDSERQGVWAYYFVNREALESLRNDADRFLDGLG